MPLRYRRLARILFGFGLALLAVPASAKGPNVKKLGEQCQKGKPAACAELTQLARTDSSFSTRGAALVFVTDKTVLAEIAKSDSFYGNRVQAVNRIDEQAVLLEIAKGDKDSQVRRAAVAKLTDPAGLIEIVKMGQSEAKAALERVEDQAALTEVALDTGIKDAALRTAALEKITDPASLVRVAEGLGVGYGFEYGAAAQLATKIKDQPALARLATSAASARMRDQARAQLTDAKLLADLIKTADVKDTAWMSDLKKISDTAVLADLALGARNPRLRLDALHGVRDVAVLGKAAKDPDPKVKAFAAARLLALKANASLSGVLIESSLGRPAASMRVALGDPMANVPLAVTESDAEGRFTFAGVEAGAWELHVGGRRVYPKTGVTVSMPATGKQALGSLEIRIDPMVTAALGSVCDGKAQELTPAVNTLVFVRKDDRWEHDSGKLEHFSKAGLAWKAALCLTTSSREVGQYVDSTGRRTGSAYATDWNVVLVRVDSGQSWKSFFSARPPQQTQSLNGFSFGSGDPTSQVLDWLKTIQ